MPPLIPTGVPFAQIPHALILDVEVSHTAVRVYCYLKRRADSEGRAFPGVRRIATETSMGRNTVRRGIEALEAAGWISVEREYDAETQKHKVNRYMVHGTRVGSEWTQGVSELDPGGGVTTDTELDPPLTTSIELVAPNGEVKERPRNLWWDELVDMFGEPTTETRERLYGRITKLVTDQPVSEIRRRAAWIIENWGHEKLTITSLETHWSRFDAAIGQVSDADVEAFTDAQDKAAMLERLADE